MKPILLGHGPTESISFSDGINDLQRIYFSIVV